MTAPKIEAVSFWVCPNCDHYYLERVSECDCRVGQRKLNRVSLYSQSTVDALLAEVERLKGDANFWTLEAAKHVQRATSAEAAAMADGINAVYTAIPSLPITPDTMEAATDAFILFCHTFNDRIEVDAARASGGE